MIHVAVDLVNKNFVQHVCTVQAAQAGDHGLKDLEPDIRIISSKNEIQNQANCLR